MDTTVLIPTANRPHLLRSTLKSVARQSATSRIACVHVSENGGNRDSGLVCAEFPSLPIRYTFRQPTIKACDHFIDLVQNTTTAYTAVLHDDDWWAPHHLARSLADLDMLPEAVARFSAFWTVASETTPAASDPCLPCWFATVFLGTIDTWALDADDMLLACLASTPTRYSTLVLRTKSLAACMDVYRMGNNYDNDRMLAVSLARQGRVIFDPVPGTYIRSHPGQDALTYDYATSSARMEQTTHWMLDTSTSPLPRIGELITERLRSCPPEHHEEILRWMRSPWCLHPLRAKHLSPDLLERFDELENRPPLKEAAWRRCVPPVIFSLVRKARKCT
jgi:Glycosyl transferase family 2